MPTNINGNTGIDKVQDGTVVSADIATLDASKLTGSIAAARIANNTIDSAHIASGAVDDAHISGIAATKLTGTIADARFPSTLPAASAANLTAIPAANITGTLPAISGASLTGLPGPTAATMPTSSIIGVQQAWMAGTQTITTSEVDVTDGGTGLTITSTNTNATKFLVKSNIYVGANSDVGCWFYLYVNIDGAGYTKLTAAHSNYGGGGSSTKNFMTACAGDNDTWSYYTGSHASQEYLYTPSFSTSVAFKIRAKGYSSNHFIGRMWNHNNSSAWSHAAPSSLTVYEIK